MGPKLRADKKRWIFVKKYLSYSKGQEKEFYHNVRILYIGKQETGLLYECNKAGVAEALHILCMSAMKQRPWGFT